MAEKLFQSKPKAIIKEIVLESAFVEDEDRNHIAHQLQEGYTSGQFLGEDGKRIAWDIDINIIE
jgi:hypothetical protein